MPRDPITREDVTSLVEARRELGEELEPEVIDAFLDRVEAAAEQRAAQRKPPPREIYPGQGRREQLALSIISLGTGIPITAIAAEQGGVQGIIVAWLGIVGVNFVASRKK